MVHLIKRTGKFYLDMYVDGRRVKKSCGTADKKTAEMIRRKVEADLVLGKFDLKQFNKKNISLSEFFEAYFQFAVSFKKLTTIKNEKHYAERFICCVGNRNLRHLDSHTLDMWKVELLQSYSPATFNIHRRFLHAAFNVAIKWGYAEINPFASITKLKVEEKRLYMTKEEIGKLFSLIAIDVADPTKGHLRKYNSIFKAFIEFLLLTGLRRQEAISLTPNDIDMENDVLLIKNTKGKRDRAIPLHPRAKEIIVENRSNLFSKLHPTSVSHKFKKLCFRAGISSEFKLHSLRHSFGTALNENGVDISSIQNLLGHADIRTTLIYSKITINKLKKDINTLAVPGKNLKQWEQNGNT